MTQANVNAKLVGFVRTLFFTPHTEGGVVLLQCGSLRNDLTKRVLDLPNIIARTS